MARSAAPGVLFLGLNMQDATGYGTGFLRHYGSDYLNVRDPTNAVAQRYARQGCQRRSSSLRQDGSWPT